MNGPEVLRTAADIIKIRGWVKGYAAVQALEKPRGPRCAVFALREVADPDNALLQRAWTRLARFVGVEDDELSDWNDRQPSGVSVIRAMRGAAKPKKKQS